MKLCAILGATTSPAGTMRGQSNRRQVCVSLNLFPANAPQVDIPEAQKKFDGSGKLTDEPTRKAIGQLMNALKELVLRFVPAAR